jgi:response regulator RpfG family c-di-GMP phosphodiesterase
MSFPKTTPSGAIRVIICDYNSLLQSVTGLLRMSGYCVFQAYNGQAAVELCAELHGIGLLVLNTEGTGMDTPALVRSIRETSPGLSVLHIGTAPLPGMPSDVVHVPESFTAEQLLETVRALVPGHLVLQR